LKAQYIQQCLEGTGDCEFPVNWPDFNDQYWHRYDNGKVTFWLGEDQTDIDDPDIVDTGQSETGILTTVDSWQEDQGTCYTRANLYKGGGVSKSLTFRVNCASTVVYDTLLPFKTKSVKINYNRYEDGTCEFISITGG
jgi:hypothetical protein